MNKLYRHFFVFIYARILHKKIITIRIPTEFEHIIEQPQESNINYPQQKNIEKKTNKMTKL